MPVIKSQKTELNQTIEELENTLRDKEEVGLHVIERCAVPHIHTTQSFKSAFNVL